MTTGALQFPQMNAFHRVIGLPMVELALTKSAETYTKVKDCHQLIHWAFTMAELSLSSATKQAVPIAAPIVKRFESPIQLVDDTLCRGLDKIEEKMPMVKEKPEQIYENAKSLAMQTVQPAVATVSHVNDMILTQASNIKGFSWNTANQLLATHYGSVAVRGIDSGAVVVDKLIDRYFPATGVEQPTIEISSVEEDKLLHTLQTVGRLSNKAARRVYTNVVQHLGTINKDNLKSYVNSLVEFLRLTQYVQTINDKSEAPKNTQNETEEKPTKNKSD